MEDREEDWGYFYKTSLHVLRNYRRHLELLPGPHFLDTQVTGVFQLSSQQQPTTEPSFLVKNEPAPLAAEISSSFHGLEQALIEMMKYVHGSPAANGFLETIMAQMNGIHKGVMNEVPGTTMTQYLTTLGTASENKEKGYAGNHSLVWFVNETKPQNAGMTQVEKDKQLKALFTVPKKRKTRSYMKLDEWPSEEFVSMGGRTASNSSLILSAHSTTEPLSPPHESDLSRTATESCASCREAEAKTSSQVSSSKKTATDRPPTAINSQMPTDSDKSPGITFETAKIIANPRQKIGTAPSSIPSTSSQVSQPTSSSYAPPQKTPDPVKLSAAKAALKQASNKLPEIIFDFMPIHMYWITPYNTKVSKSCAAEFALGGNNVSQICLERICTLPRGCHLPLVKKHNVGIFVLPGPVQGQLGGES
ncbi:unnamed protein product [Haemonchus placei]|uniref:Integrase catalytic domain-containing protein n=1 Tax=Haemonchus placei TaxID=6290 RepID=A0A0N4WJC4_HAEPC|nr:unnamed protein product [Haemonchus placei]